jgi:hypothetical protein
MSSGGGGLDALSSTARWSAGSIGPEASSRRAQLDGGAQSTDAVTVRAEDVDEGLGRDNLAERRGEGR